MFHACACIANLGHGGPNRIIGYMDFKTGMQLLKLVSARNVESPPNHAHVHVYRCVCVLDILIKDIYIYTRVYIWENQKKPGVVKWRKQKGRPGGKKIGLG